ncbi:alkyl sulfatase dimerization domain-containing protein [Sphaerimonospora thailandensis]|uniref:Alkyl sulfatase n=1 Tax=Sphaerimonospora thailandensis TaxID=795644 RepID=A0A8J3R570_9ACTN|nr:alkyl sulfatase dimerization domain-containing protein [Sphaerimonospora thailandensis]GIH68046.1 alkyl sulfatase [Sphaerimonospora thailandensis]
MSETLSDQVDKLIDDRPGKDLLTPAYDDAAVALNDFVYSSGGHTNAYVIVTDAGRVIVNTGLGYEAPHHRHLFDQVCAGPTPYIITTQGHTDHVGGVAAFRAPETVYVAQRNNQFAQHQDARIRGRMRLWSAAWFDLAPTERIATFARERPDVPMRQDAPTPDLTFDERLSFSVGGVDFELWHGTGETTDGAIVWLPRHRVALISNMLGPLFCHFPNLNTLRGHSYRFVEPYLATIRRIRELQPEMLVTGRGEPIVGAELIDACLQRMHDAVDFVHRETLRGINEGADLATLVREIALPAELRVGQGYGKVSWGVRTIWESYLGWFHHDRTSALLPLDQSRVLTDLVEIAGAGNVLRLAGERMRQKRFAEATTLGEAVLAHSPGDRDALRLLVESHRNLLDDPENGANFWLSGWLEHQIDGFTQALDEKGA